MASQGPGVPSAVPTAWRCGTEPPPARSGRPSPLLSLYPIQNGKNEGWGIAGRLDEKTVNLRTSMGAPITPGPP